MCATADTEPAVVFFSKSPTSPPPRKNKRNLRFADTVGLPLVQTKEYDEDEEVLLPNVGSEMSSIPIPTLQISFPQSVIGPWLLKNVLVRHVILESCSTHDLTLSGSVLVHNLCFEKRVTLRYTVDSWITSEDICGSYHSTVNESVDRFSFSLSLPHLTIGMQIEFCVAFTVRGTDEFWDNNFSRNYVVRCVEQVLQRDVPKSGRGRVRGLDNLRSLSGLLHEVGYTPYW